MLAGRSKVLEVGCADAFGTRIVQQHVESVTAVDFDPIFIADIKERANPHWPLECFVHDILAGPVPGAFDAAYALDVLEHIPPEKEDVFMQNIAASLGDGGALILGMPSLESQAFASPQSRAGHVNCKTEQDFKALMQRVLPFRVLLLDERRGGAHGILSDGALPADGVRRPAADDPVAVQDRTSNPWR